MTTSAVDLVTEPDAVRRALTPLRRRLLERLRTPASATQLAGELDLSRQKVNYHLRALEDAGLLELVEQRQRRGFVERVLRSRAHSFVVDPSVITGAPSRDEQAAGDRHAAGHLVDVASQTVRDVVRMQAAAERAGTRLLTFTLETDVRLASPGDVHRLSDDLAAAVAGVVARFDDPDGRPYRVVAGGHPAPRTGDQA